MRRSRSEAYKLSIGIYTVGLVIVQLLVLLIGFLVKRFIVASPVVNTVAIACATLTLFAYIICIYRSWHAYRHKAPNENPWHGGIYRAYYECPKCGSLHGGIYGKGPTKAHITDKACIHDWQAIYSTDFILKLYKATGNESGSSVRNVKPPTQ